MRDLIILLVHLIVTLARLLGPGQGSCSVPAETAAACTGKPPMVLGRLNSCRSSQPGCAPTIGRRTDGLFFSSNPETSGC